jgi:peroxiredoxin (alkyl hydroperoxide reductase subunit C)
MSTLVQKQAPDFEGTAVVGKDFKNISLSDFKGKWLTLFFYPLDFTFVCPTEITSFSDAFEEFKKINCEVVGCSVDSQFSHLAWIQQPRKEGGLGDLNYPLLSDLTKNIARDYGVLTEGGVALRGLFVIDPKGTVRYEVVNDLAVGRNVNEVLRTISAFQQADKSGEVCPAGWTPGGDTMTPNPTDSKKYFESKA